MKHLLVTNDFPPKIGGIQSLLWEWWRRLPAESFAVLTSPYAGAAETERTISRRMWTWQRNNDTNLALTVPSTPLPTKQQTQATAAQVGPNNPWNADNL